MIEQRVDLDILEFCRQLDISILDLQELMGSKNKIQVSKKAETNYSFIFCLDEYKKHLEQQLASNEFSRESFKTYISFLMRIRKLINQNSPHLLIDDFNAVELTKLLNKMTNKPYSENTLNKHYAIIRSLFNFSYIKGYSSKNNLNKQFKFKQIKLLPRYIEDNNIIKILETVDTFKKNLRDRTIILFLLYTGCRVSEAVKLKLTDLDLENNIIYINKSKGNKSRTVPLPQILKLHILKYLKNAELNEWDSTHKGYLFSKKEDIFRSIPLTIRTFERILEKVKMLTQGLEHITLHQFRHTYAVNCLKNGLALHIVSLILGHEDPKTTMIYTQLYDKDLAGIINEIYPFPIEELLRDILMD